jgi:hypothetical protein
LFDSVEVTDVAQIRMGGDFNLNKGPTLKANTITIDVNGTIHANGLVPPSPPLPPLPLPSPFSFSFSSTFYLSFSSNIFVGLLFFDWTRSRLVLGLLRWTWRGCWPCRYSLSILYSYHCLYIYFYASLF